MIDLDVSERVCDDLIEHGLGYLPPAGIGNSVSIKELITRLRQAEKDAARYRRLRDGSVDLDWIVDGEDKTHVDITVLHNDGFDSDSYGIDATAEEVDAIIDKEIQCCGDVK